MSKFNLQSFLFAAIVLVSVMFSPYRQPASPGASLADESRRASQGGKAADQAPANSDLVAEISGANKAIGLIVRLRSPQVSQISLISQISPPVDISVSAALVKELGSEKVIWSANGEARWPLASLTKLMTAVVALEQFGPDELITITADAVRSEGDQGTFRVGEVFSTSDLIKAMVAVSSNDAAVSLADHFGFQKFVDLMQEKAAGLGMRETAFIDPTGLSFLDQSTPTDMARLAEYSDLNHPEILATAQSKEVPILEKNSGKVRRLTSINSFSGQTDFIGGKTGYTDEAKGNLLSLFQIKSRKFLIIVFGADDRFVQTNNIYQWLKDYLKIRN